MADKQFTYYNVKAHEEQVIDMCEGNIQIIIDALADYADMMSKRMESEQMDARTQITWRYRFERIKGIQTQLEQATGYIRDEQCEKCRRKEIRKQDDVGDDAFNMLTKKK